MKSGRFSEQILGILKGHEAGLKIGDLTREVGVSDWKRERRLKHFVADLDLDKASAQSGHDKRRLELAAQRQDVGLP